MARLVATARSIASENGTSQACDVPSDRISGDRLICVVSQDLGTGTVSLTAGWDIIGSQSQQNGQRTICYEKISDGTETSVTATSTLSEEMTLTVMVWRGVHSTDGIHGYNSLASNNSMASPALTTKPKEE